MAKPTDVREPSRWSLRGLGPGVLGVVCVGAVAAVSLLGGLAPALGPAIAEDPLKAFSFAAVALLLQFGSFDVYGRGTYSFVSVGLLAIGFAVHPAAAVVVAVLTAVLRFVIGKGKLYRAVFDASQYALAAGVSTGVYSWLAPDSGVAWHLALVAGAIYYFLNVGLLSVAMGVEEGTTPWAVWRERFQWMLPYTIASGPFAGAILFAYDIAGVFGVAVFTVPPVFMRFSAHQYIAKTKESIEEIRKVNAELEEANRQISESEEHFRSLIEDASDAIAVVEPDGRLSYGSPALSRLLGRPLEEAIGRVALGLLPRAARRAALEAIERQLRRGSSEPFELSLGGEQVWELVVRRFEDQGSRPRLVLTVRDVTARKATEAALARSQEQLQHSQRLEAVGRLAGGVAHDFNNLLTVMMGCSEFLMLQLDEDDPRRAEAEEIQRAATRASSLTRQLLAFSRKQVLEPQALDLNASVRDMEGMLVRLLGAEVRLETETTAEAVPVFADPGQIEQVIVNLVVNARDAMGDKGQIRIAVGSPEGELPAGLEPGEYVVLSVTDTGCGMDEETRSKIFEPFFTTKEVGKGTGLGLSTVYGIVKQTGGEIVLESEVGVGTTFRIFLPRHDGPISEAADVTDVTHHAADATILLVDDDDAVRRIATTVLEEQGYRILAARNGIDALELARAFSRPIHLLLTDIVMPEMTGAALALTLRQERPDMSILYMSGHVGDAAFEEDGPALLHKPFSGSALLKAVQSALSSPARQSAGTDEGAGEATSQAPDGGTTRDSAKSQAPREELSVPE